MLRRRRDGVFGVGFSMLDEELTPEVLQTTERSGRHRHAAPAAALAIEHREDEGHAEALARQPSDHFCPPPRLTEGALD